MDLKSWRLCWVTCLVSCPNLNVMIWSEQLSSSQIFQSMKFWSSRLLITVGSMLLLPLRLWNVLITVRSMLLLPLRLWNVVLSLSSFIICRSLLDRISPNVLPLDFVRLSCHTFDQGMAVHGDEDAWAFNELYYFINRCLSISSFMSRYILAIKILMLLYFSSKTTLSISHSWLISTASIISLVIIMAARLVFGGYLGPVSLCNSCCFVLN